MLDKENIRQWLIEQGFKGEGTPPKLSDDIKFYYRKSIWNYIRLLLVMILSLLVVMLKKE